MIKTFADCPHRREDIRPIERVLASFDYTHDICPDRCPVSPRNSDYSTCHHPNLEHKEVLHCPSYYKAHPHLKPGHVSYGIDTRWCEVNTAHRICPMGYAR